MKTLIYQVYTGERSALYDHCTQSVKEYADRIQKKPLPDFYDNKLKEEFTLEVCNHTHSLWDDVKENAPSLAVLKKKIKSGQKLGSTETASAKARGLIKRSDGTKRKSDKYK